MKQRFSFFFVILLCVSISFFSIGCKGGSSDFTSGEEASASGVITELKYADQFSIEQHDTFHVIRIEDGLKYVVLPEGAEVPSKIGNEDSTEYTIIYQPLDSIYLAASSVMDLIFAIDGIDRVSMTATKSNDWGLPEIRTMVESDEILYVGKYSAPDYEAVIENECDLAIESTMIYHNPGVKEELEALGIPVMIERSSYEAHPLGRLEWIKLYGILLDLEDEANAFFESQEQTFLRVLADTENRTSDHRPKVAFFSISANGYATVRKPGDYISQMIYMAGGEYAMKDLAVSDENSLSTTNIQLESFYKYAAESDILIYNSAIQGEINSISELIDKFPELSNTEAVQSGRVYCTHKNVYQATAGISEMLEEMARIISDENSELVYFRKLS